MKSIQMMFQRWKKPRRKSGVSTMKIEMKRQFVIETFLTWIVILFPIGMKLMNLYLYSLDMVHQIPGSAKPKPVMKHMMSSSLDVTTTSSSQKKLPGENLQLAECVGDVRALLIDILCDEIALSVESEGYDSTMEIIDECHTTFLSCFNAFYPTNTLKWNCLCDLLLKKDKVIFFPIIFFKQTEVFGS